MVRNEDRLPNTPIDGLTLENGLEVTDAFLRWYRSWLKANNPHAEREINACTELIDDMPTEINELDEEEDLEEDEEDD